jgi:hypothetical protein
MSEYCLMINGGCGLLSRRDWTCKSDTVQCNYKPKPRDGKRILYDFVKGLDPIEREALVRYLEEKHDKG